MSDTTLKSTAEEKVARIAALNDQFRKTWMTGRVMITQGVQALPEADLSSIAQRVRTFDDFTADNDPYGEHDFGAFDHAGRKIFWKIDCYALDMMHGSEDPSDPSKTRRVLTIMLAEEY